jgi:hypothetical protein
MERMHANHGHHFDRHLPEGGESHPRLVVVVTTAMMAVEVAGGE